MFRSIPVTSILALLLLALTTQGCFFARGTLGERVDEEALAKISTDKTNRRTVVELLGAPDDIFDAGDYEIFHYRRFDSKLAFLLFLSRLNLTSDNLYIFFDDDGVVKEIVFGKRTDRLPFQFWPFGD